MPNRYSQREDPPYTDVYGWDDGFEYIKPDPVKPEPFRSSFAPPETMKPPKTAKYMPRAPPPPLAADDFDMRHPIHDEGPYAPHRRSRRPSPSPIRKESPTRDRHHRDHPRDSHHRDSHRHHDTRHAPAPVPRHHDRPRRPSPSRMKTTPPAPSGRERGHRRTKSNSPPRPSRRHHNPDRPVRSETSPKHSSSGRDREAKRPPIQRSKTTKDMGAALLGHPRFQKAAAAALQAGAGTAFNLRRAPGSWGGEKGARVATAALGAAALDAFAKAERKKEASGAADPGPAKKQPGGVEAMGSALGGLLADQLARNGSKKKSRR